MVSTQRESIKVGRLALLLKQESEENSSKEKLHSELGWQLTTTAEVLLKTLFYIVVAFYSKLF